MKKKNQTISPSPVERLVSTFPNVRTLVGERDVSDAKVGSKERKDGR